MKSTSTFQCRVLAIEHSYVDIGRNDGLARPEEVIFTLNAAELDREDEKLERQLEMLKFGERQLSEEYINTFVMSPLDGMVDLASSDVEDTREIAERISD